MSAIILDQEMVHYEVLGHGRPVVFLHGWVGSWRYWIPSMQATSTSFRAYAIDLWGFGDSAKNPERYFLDWQILLLGFFLSKLGIEKTALVGHGLGGVIGLIFSALYPAHVDRIMVINIPAGKNGKNAHALSAIPKILEAHLAEQNSSPEAAVREAIKTDPRAIQSTLTQTQQIDFLDLWTNLNTPCLWLHSDNDPVAEVTNPEHPADFSEHIHQVIFEGSGHFPMLDEPSKFNRLLVDFLALESGESPRRLLPKEEWKRRLR